MQITAYVEKDCDYNGVIDLITSIKNNFNLIHIMLGSSEHTEKILHPEKIFESLNATGRMLSEFEYLRNNLFLRAGKLGEDKKGKSYSDIFYDKYWHFESDMIGMPTNWIHFSGRFSWQNWVRKGKKKH